MPELPLNPNVYDLSDVHTEHKLVRAFRLEVRLKYANSKPAYMGFDDAETAQGFCTFVRNANYGTEVACEISWRDWEKVNEHTGEPVWVMFPW